MRDEACPMSGTADAEKGDPIYMGKVSKECHGAREGFGVASRWEQSSFPVGSGSNPGGYAEWPRPSCSLRDKGMGAVLENQLSIARFNSIYL